MITVVSPHLVAVGATWDDGPDAGRWIRDRLGPFGPSVGHAVPLCYPAYTAVPIPADDDPAGGRGPLGIVEALLDVLGRFTADQPVHSGMWEGWGWWYDTGCDPRTAPGMSVSISSPEGVTRPAQDVNAQTLADARERLVAARVERPDVELLDLPARRYYLWTGPLRSAMAFRHQSQHPPSLIWPEDRSWFVGIPIYAREIAVAATSVVISAVLADQRLGARPATPDDVLVIDD